MNLKGLTLNNAFFFFYTIPKTIFQINSEEE